MIRPESKGIVLVADDAAESLAMMNEALTSAGYTVLLAMDGTQALSITERMIPDLILLDAIMPTMDGFTACETLKKRNELH
ncbi:MAG: response regulator, partial [Thalassolituus oleivorans]